MSKPSIQVVFPDSPDFKPLFDFYVQFSQRLNATPMRACAGTMERPMEYTNTSPLSARKMAR